MPTATLHGILAQEISPALMNTHQTLALPLDRTLTYFELQLVTQVAPTEAGILVTMMIPVAGPTGILDLYRIQKFPMDLGNGTAATWKFNADYIAPALNHKEYALLSETDLQECHGTTHILLCSNPLPTRQSLSECEAALFFRDNAQLLAKG